MESHKPQSKVLKWSLIIGIIIVLNLFFNYALYLVFPSPEYQAFCPQTQVVTPPTTQKACLAVGGQWIENTVPQDQATSGPVIMKTNNVSYCNPDYTCSNTFQNALKTYNKNIFISLIILGIVTLALGLFLRISEPVTIALSFGGVLTLVIASMRYWSFADTILKVIILGIALAALIWIGIRKFEV